MKEAKVSELKAHLSGYLDEVRRGATVIVFDRKTPVARLVPYREDADQLEEPVQGRERLRALKPVRLKRRVDLVKLLRESRDQR